jgi:lipopolysaccharide/colanic/teichoic acid biosynthesis glycosyltransferase
MKENIFVVGAYRYAKVVIDAILSLDVWYVGNWNLWLDFRIIILTILKVLKRERISTEGIFKSISNI